MIVYESANYSCEEEAIYQSGVWDALTPEAVWTSIHYVNQHPLNPFKNAWKFVVKNNAEQEPW